MDGPRPRCSNGRMRLDFETRASPAQVRRALTDFSDRRLQTWHRSMDPKTYKVLDSGDTWAVAKESSARSPFWVVCRYDWSDPDVVRWTITESSYGGGGEGFARASPLAEGGSRVHAQWENTGAPWTQKPLLFLVHVRPMRRVFRGMWKAALDEYADTDLA